MSDEKNKKKKIIISGGGTMGSVTPLLVLAESLKDRYDFVFVGSYRGIERQVVAKIPYLEFRPLLNGKFRRYFSLANFFDLFKIAGAYFQSWLLLAKIKPSLIISAGAYISVPLVWAARGRRIPVLIHQQDIRPGLANRLMAKGAALITTVFAKSVADYGAKAIWVGNPIKEISQDKAEAIVAAFRIDPARPLILALGGGTGAFSLNRLVISSRSELAALGQIIHITGQNKQIGQSLQDNYQAYDFLEHEKILALMKRADLVISRAGLGVISELAALAKPAILIPMPESHQDDNAVYLAQQAAALVLSGPGLDSERLIETVRTILGDETLRRNLADNIRRVMPKDANEHLKLAIIGLVEKKSSSV